ncbi:hypothetical protein [Streptomyces sp. NPDC002133]|uniref:hypothetical protein n=1 Tax=Streptomyces sp. NPDC002133 TaxID=3154409 RepID=UPI003318A06D
MRTTTQKALTHGQSTVLGTAALPMVCFGAAGAWGTYTNVKTHFPQSATALGVVAAGEGATLVLALVYIGLTLLGQPSPAPVRIGLWTLPVLASATSAVIATSVTEAVVYAVTPVAMCASAEGMGLLARRIVVYRTGVDTETQRRNAETLQRLAYHRALATSHPSPKARKRAELKSWRLARKVGTHDTELTGSLLTVQRQRITAGADSALASMFGATVTERLPRPVTPELPTTHEHDRSRTNTNTTTPGRHSDAHERKTPPPPPSHTPRHNATGGVTATVTQASTDTEHCSSHASVQARPPATHPHTETVPAYIPEKTPIPAVTPIEFATVADTPTPLPNKRLTDEQLETVLRDLHRGDHPPLSYRQAVKAFREAGYIGSEQRVRKAWAQTTSHAAIGAALETTQIATQE